MNEDADQVAFSIASLPTLSAAKAFDNKTSILQYVVMLILKNDPVCALFPDELTHTLSASRYPMEIVTSEVSSLCKGLDTCKRVMESISNSSSGMVSASGSVSGSGLLPSPSVSEDGGVEGVVDGEGVGFTQFMTNVSRYECIRILCIYVCIVYMYICVHCMCMYMYTISLYPSIYAIYKLYLGFYHNN